MSSLYVLLTQEGAEGGEDTSQMSQEDVLEAELLQGWAAAFNTTMIGTTTIDHGETVILSVVAHSKREVFLEANTNLITSLPNLSAKHRRIVLRCFLPLL